MNRNHDFKAIWPAVKASFPKLKFFYLLLFITALFIMLTELYPPLILKNIINLYLSHGMQKMLWKEAVLYLLISTSGSILSFLETFMTTYIGQNILIELRLLMANHLTKLSMNYYSKTPTGETMSRMTSDVDAVNTLFSSGIITAFTNFLKIFGILGAMFIISPVLALIALGATPFIYFVSSFFRHRMYKAQLGIRKVVGNVNTFLQEVYSGIKVIKIYGKEKIFEDKFQPYLNNYLKANNYAAYFDSYFPCILQVIRAIAIAAIVLTGAKTGTLDPVVVSIGGLAAFIDLAGRLFSPIESLSQQFQVIQQASAGLKRISEFLNEPVEEKGVFISPDSDNIKMTISCDNVSFGYQENKPVLHGVTFKLSPGEKAALIGRTGAGKTSLIQLIAGLYPVWSGEIKIGGIDPYKLAPDKRRRLIGVVMQTVHIFEGTIQDNISLRDETISKDDIIQAAKTVGIHDFIEGLTDKYNTVLGSSGMKLSAGQNQLLALARAIVTNPPLLLLDEPTSGMDALTEEMLFKALRNAGQNRTILTISHRLSGIIDADKVYIIAKGKIVESGTSEELAGEKGFYQVFKQLEDMGWQVD